MRLSRHLLLCPNSHRRDVQKWVVWFQTRCLSSNVDQRLGHFSTLASDKTVVQRKKITNLSNCHPRQRHKAVNKDNLKSDYFWGYFEKRLCGLQRASRSVAIVWKSRKTRSQKTKYLEVIFIVLK